MKTIGSETIYYVFGVEEYSSFSGWDKVYVHLGSMKLLEYASRPSEGLDMRAKTTVALSSLLFALSCVVSQRQTRNHFMDFKGEMGWIFAGTRAYVTKDGGLTWEASRLKCHIDQERSRREILGRVAFVDQLVGYTNFSGGLLKTEDSGESWRRIMPRESGLAGIFFKSRLQGLD